MWIIVALIVLGIGIGISATRDNPLSKFILEFFNDWSIALGAGATVILALVAFRSLAENRRMVKEERQRDRLIRETDKLTEWTEEARRLLYSSYYDRKDEINSGLKELVRKAVAATAAAIVVGDEFAGLTKRATQALVGFHSAIKAEIKEDKPVDKSATEEFQNTFESLYFYLSLFRTWDYDYDAFIKEVKAHGALPLSQHLHPEP